MPDLDLHLIELGIAPNRISEAKSIIARHVEAERKACADLVRSFASSLFPVKVDDAAKAIEARGSSLICAE